MGLAAGVILGLSAPVITIPRERYIVDVSAAPAPLLYETLEAPPLVAIERPYSLDEIRYNVALRDRMRRIDIDSITFDSGSWEVTPEQQPRLAGGRGGDPAGARAQPGRSVHDRRPHRRGRQ